LASFGEAKSFSFGRAHPFTSPLLFFLKAPFYNAPVPPFRLSLKKTLQRLRRAGQQRRLFPLRLQIRVLAPLSSGAAYDAHFEKFRMCLPLSSRPGGSPPPSLLPPLLAASAGFAPGERPLPLNGVCSFFFRSFFFSRKGDFFRSLGTRLLAFFFPSFFPQPGSCPPQEGAKVPP